MLKNLLKITTFAFATAIILPMGMASACISDVGKGGPPTNCVGAVEIEGHSHNSSSGYTESGNEMEEDGVCDEKHNCSEAQGTNTGETDCIDAQGNTTEGMDGTCGTDISSDEENA